MKAQNTNRVPSQVANKTPRVIRGQGMTEYIIVVALIALTAVVAVGYFGDTIQAQFAGMGHGLSGNKEAADASIESGDGRAALADEEVTTQDGLDSYAK